MESKILEFNDKCFPRIHYLGTRLTRFFPRMKNVLKFEFTSPDRGLKSMRSDDDKIETIGKLIQKDILVKCSSANTDLLNAITEEVLAVKPETAGVNPKTDDKTSSSDLSSIVTLIVTTEKCLEETVKLADVDYLRNAVLAVFVEDKQNRPEFDFYSERLKRRSIQNVTIKRSERDISSSQSISDTMTQSLYARRTPRLELTETEEGQCSVKVDSFRDWRESNESMKSPPGSRSNSPRRMPGNMRTRQKSLSPCPQSDFSTSDHLSPLHTKESKQKHKKQKLDINNSAPNFSRISGSQKPIDVPDSNEYLKVTETTEKGESDRHNPSKNQQPQIDFENININDWDIETLKKTVSLHLEIHIADIIKQIIDFLKSIRARRDSSAKVDTVTTLDKLIYEIEGLLSQSITEAGKKMKEEIEQSRLNTNVTKDLLSVNGVYGCGTVYNRLNVHIEVGTDKEKEEIKDRIREIAERNNVKDTDYDVSVVQSRPTEYGRLIVCC